MNWRVYSIRVLIFCLALLGCHLYASGQECPPNIDFERGNFDGWTCYTGTVAAVGDQNTFTLSQSSPIPDRHTLISGNTGDLDPYGGFPVLCPNGSGYSIKLGNDLGGGQGEGISYEFTIPANRPTYSLIYHYAVVFQDPNHQQYEQPRMEIEITNVSTNTIIDCASFTFIPFGTSLPGFFESSVSINNTPVWCKNWTAVSINLDGNAGKTIRLQFRTGDCTFRRHFGYAYIDVDSDCSGEFVGASYCPDDSVVNVVAPYGYQNYTWLDKDLNRVLGNQQILQIKPPPPSGTTVNVRLTPYPGYGCPQTLTARLINNLKVTADAGRDTVSCNYTPVQIGVRPRPGLVYSWAPAAGLNNPAISNPFASPNSAANYILTVRSSGGGCLSRDTVHVNVSLLDTALRLMGQPAICLGTPDSAVLSVSPTDSIRWLKDGEVIPGAETPRYRVLETGIYRARLADTLGCLLTTNPKSINISSIPDAEFGVNDTIQCLVNNRFVFSNTSTNAVGAMQYQWTVGNELRTSGKDVDYSFSNAGNFEVKLVVRTNDVCVDSLSANVTIHPNAVANFEAPSVCVNLPMQIQNLTPDSLGSPVRYRWDLGNGQLYTDRQPPAQVYTKPGNYRISLTAFTDQCPSPPSVLVKNLVVESPAKGINHPIQFAVINLPYPMKARNIGESVLWTPNTFLSDDESFTPLFTGDRDQEYLVAMTTKSGCLTVDTMLVQTVKNAEIYVATGFTPNADGKNDFLRPVLMGIRELRYFRIYNRWGEVLFESRNEKPGWDGRLNGILQASQAVVWAAEGIGFDGKTYVRKGSSVLVR